jgi:hypothetical protein
MLIGTVAAVALLADDVAKLGWMAGVWTQPKNGGAVTETWLPPQDGAMAGVTLTTRPGRPAVAEFSKITVEPAGVTYTAVVGGQPPTPFVLLPGPDGEATFENKSHDFPQRVIYRRSGADLCARIEGTIQGKLQSQEWRYTRVK